MKAKHLSLAMAALLAAGGLWLAWSAWRAHAPQKSSMGVGSKTTHGQKSSMGIDVKTPQGSSKPDQMLRPPDPSRRFRDFTPEERVNFARKGHGPGG